MAQIRKISFERVDRNHSESCDRCGQAIMNVWTVEFSDGLSYHFGCDCFEKLYKSGSSLNDYGKKQFKKLLKRIEAHKDGYNRWLNATEESERARCAETGMTLPIDTTDKLSAWYGWSFKEYKEWMLNEYYGERFKEDERELAKFNKVRFNVE